MLMNAINRSTRNGACGYEDAIKTLNSLQSSDAELEARKKNYSPRRSNSVQEITKYLIRSGISLDQLNNLHIIHVSGTKGKGSTCAFVESILREHGYRTGFYSSPHLVNVRERFQINGHTISESKFTNYFWKIYDILDSRKEHQTDCPKYFLFLTIMMIHMFLEAKLDVAIVEVGIGGEFDYTNVIQSPICTGVSSLGLDHCAILGHTIKDIAFQKSGIFKRNCPAFTLPQPPEAMEVLKQRALEKGCELSVVPPLSSYPWLRGEPKLGIQSKVQIYNASLAIQLSNCWISRKALSLKDENHFISNTIMQNPLPETAKLCLSLEKVSKAIANCKWPGRTQIMFGKTADFYLDGAHTTESICNCITWFEEHIRDSPGKKYLVFNLTKNRDALNLIMILKRFKFDSAYFVPNFAGSVKITDQVNIKNPVEKQLINCKIHRDIWGDGGEVVESVSGAFDMIADRSAGEMKPNVLICGSLHLVGSALSILDPKLTMHTDF